MSRNFNNNSADFIDLGDITGVDFARLTPWSFLAFFRVENTTGDNRTIFAKWGSSTQRIFKVETDTEAAPASLEFHMNTTVLSRTGNLVELDTWYLVAATNNGGGGAGDLIFYLYEMDLTELLNSSQTHPGDPGATTAICEIGVDDGTGSPTNPFDGDIAHVAYLDRALSSQEIKNFVGNPGRCVMAWRAAGDQVFFHHDLPGESPEPDRSGSGNDGTVTGSPTVGDNPPVALFPASGGLSSFPIAAAGDGGDAERKRRSVAATGRRWRGPVILPDGSLSQGDRYAAARNYWREAAAKQGQGRARGLARAKALGAKVGRSELRARSVARTRAEALRRRPSEVHTRGIARAHGEAVRVRLAALEAVGLARTKAEASRIRTSEAKARGVARSFGRGAAVLHSKAFSRGIARTKAEGGRKGAGQAKARGGARTRAEGVRVRSGEAKARGLGRTKAESLRIRTSEIRVVGIARDFAQASRIRLADARARSLARTQAVASQIHRAEARARGIARSFGIGRSVPLLGDGRARGVARVKAVGRKIAGGVAQATGDARSHGEARRTAAGQAKAIGVARTRSEALRRRESVAAARGVARSQAIASVKLGGVASARGVARSRAEARATRRAQAKPRGLARTGAEARAVFRSEGRARGIARARATTLIIPGPLGKARMLARTKALGRRIAGGEGRAQAGARSFGILTRFEWTYELLRGETRYVFQTGYIPANVDTDLHVAHRSRACPGDLRRGRITSRGFPPHRASLRILDLATGRWIPFDLTGVVSIAFRMTDTFGNILIHDRSARVVGDPTDGVVEADTFEADADNPGARLGRWRVDNSSHRETPIFFPLRSEYPISVEPLFREVHA